MALNARRLDKVRDRASLFRFLDEELGWPLEENDHVYDVRELEGADLKEIVPFTSGDPYAIFLLESAGPVRKEIVRRAAQAVRREQRVGGQYHGKELTDLVFLCAGSGYREIRFFKFMLRGSRQPRLASFGWDERTVGTKRNNTVLKNNLPALRLAAEDGRPNWERARWARAWDTEPVTKAFYEAFETHRTDFLNHLPKAFPTEKRHWMTSLTLNRLMFAWFLADGGRIPGLKEEMVAALGRDDFYGGYFLPLCLCALGRRKGERGRWEEAFAHIPYLNGGLFERHRIEEELGVTLDGEPGQTDFPAELFRDLLREPRDGDEGGLFRRFAWTLDEQGEEATSLSPHVLGYVFERHINGLDPEQEGQKKNGAYYTKEDITGYIARSTIIPRLFDKLDERKVGRASFNLAHLSPEGTMRYVFPSVKQAGLLPTETPYEQKRRRARVEELRRANPTTADEFVTLNLNLSLLAEDFVSETRDPETLWAFYEGLREITVLDPTVGSGAFLLAALEVLAPIHRACLVRMEGMVREAADVVPVTNLAGAFHFEELAGQGTLVERADLEAVTRMRDEIEGIRAHGDPEAYVRKGIVLDNLFGVDLMPEAVEICKLRLYLALLGGGGGELEPLPDLEFNVIAGNALVGFATRDELNEHFRTIGGSLGLRWAEEEILDRLVVKLKQFAKQSLDGKPDAELKADIRESQEHVGIGLSEELRQANRRLGYGDQPLHWLVRFPRQTLVDSGFDVVVGNPPYVEMSKITSYSLSDRLHPQLGNLYGPTCVRATQLVCPGGRLSMIVPVSLPSTERMEPLRRTLAERGRVHHASFSTRPSKIFEGAEQRVTIFSVGPGRGTLSGGYLCWSGEERPNLVDGLSYVPTAPDRRWETVWAKTRSQLHNSVLEKLSGHPSLADQAWDRKGPPLYYKNTGLRYFSTVTKRSPRCWINGKAVPSSRETIFNVSQEWLNIVHCALLSSTFFVYWQAFSNCRDLNPSDLALFGLPNSLLGDGQRFSELSARVEGDYTAKAKMIKMKNKLTGEVVLESMSPARSKPIIDEIDRVLALHYGLTEAELEFVLNYDLKYRMGRDADGDPEDGA